MAPGVAWGDAHRMRRAPRRPSRPQEEPECRQPRPGPPVHTWARGGGSSTWWGQRGWVICEGLAERVQGLFADGGQRDRLAPL